MVFSFYSANLDFFEPNFHFSGTCDDRICQLGWIMLPRFQSNTNLGVLQVFCCCVHNWLIQVRNIILDKLDEPDVVS